MHFRDICKGARFYRDGLFIKIDDEWATSIKDGMMSTFRPESHVDHVPELVDIVGTLYTHGWVKGFYVTERGFRVNQLRKRGGIDITMEIRV